MTTALGSRRLNILLIFGVALGGLLYGYDVGAMSGVLLYIKHDIPMTAAQSSLFAAVFFWGGAAAMLIAGVLADIMGRKKMLVISAAAFLVSVVLIVTASSYEALIVSRSVLGVAIGVLTITIPLYISETMPAAMRGRGTVAFQLFLTFGILAATLVALLMEQSQAWRSIFMVELAPGVLLLIVVLLSSESPRWLATKGRTDKALAVLLKTRDPETAKNELEEMTQSSGDSGQSAGLAILRRRRYMVPLILAVGVGMLNQLVGINSILQYDAHILQSAGLGSDALALTGSSVITGVNFIMTIVAIAIVDRIERRKLFRIGTLGVFVVLAALAAIELLLPQGATRGVAVEICLFFFIVLFAVGPGALCWTVMSEVLPSKIRSIGLAIALFLNSIAGATLSTVFLPLEAEISFGGLFAMCAVFGLVYFLLSIALPDTSGKTLEEIEAGFAGKE